MDVKLLCLNHENERLYIQHTYFLEGPLCTLYFAVNDLFAFFLIINFIN